MSRLGDPPVGDWMGTPYLRFERNDGLARLTIDRPHKRNAMTAAMYFGVRVAIRRVEQDDALAGLLITGIDDVFAPGGDLSQTSDDQWMDLEGLLYMDTPPFEYLRQATKPVVSAVNGICQGGGLVIAMLSDMAVVSDRATFRVPELFRGIAEGGTTLVVSSHVMDEALRCDRLLLMREGRIVSDTTPAELLADTGTTDPEQAFLVLIARDAQAEAAAHPQLRRTLRKVGS